MHAALAADLRLIPGARVVPEDALSPEGLAALAGDLDGPVVVVCAEGHRLSQGVAAWLRHAEAAERIVCEAYPEGVDPQERHRALALENVVVQLANLRTHPSVAAGLAKGRLRLHGWFFEIESGALLAYDGTTGRFRPIAEADMPVAQAPALAPALAGDRMQAA